MRIQHTVPIATPQARAWETIQQPPSSLLWLAKPHLALEALIGRDFSSGAKHEFVERRGDTRYRWIVTVLLRQAPKGIDISFDRGDLRLIVRQRLRTRHGHLTEWACCFEAYPSRPSAYPLALYLQGVVAYRLRRRMRLVRADLERINERALAAGAPSSAPSAATVDVAARPVGIGVGLKGGA